MKFNIGPFTLYFKKRTDSTKPTAVEIAKYLLSLSRKDNLEFSALKILKLVYIAYGYYSAIFNKRLFLENVEAWRYGPVIPSVYYEFKKYKNVIVNYQLFQEELVEIAIKLTNNILPEKSGETCMNFLDSFYLAYKDKDELYLSSIAHSKDSPWQKRIDQGNLTKKDREISYVSIQDYYKKLIEKTTS